MGWDDRIDEQRAAAPEEPKHRSRKDRRRWCRGKVGVEHVPEITLGRSFYLTSRSEQGQPLCYRWPDFIPVRRLRLDPYWACAHQQRCSECGRILRRNLGRDCPEYPTPV